MRLKAIRACYLDEVPVGCYPKAFSSSSQPTLKGKFCSKGSKFSPLGVEGAEKGIDSFGFLESISSHLTPLFCFSLPLKERLSLGNIESIMKHVRERVENGGECSLKEINTMPLCQYLLNPDQISQVGFIIAPT